jgi:hypothetical protein
MSRQKGKRGEREAARVLSHHLGIKVKRGIQFQGSPDSPDVSGLGVIGLHPEVKRDEVTISKRLQRDLYELCPTIGVYKQSSYVITQLGDWPCPSELSTVKVTKSLFNAVEQAKDDCGEGMTPFVMARRNHAPWYIIIELKEYEEFVSKIKKAEHSQEHST